MATIGRSTGQVRLRVVDTTDKETLKNHVHQFTSDDAFVYTDEWKGYTNINRIHATVCHGKREWAVVI